MAWGSKDAHQKSGLPPIQDLYKQLTPVGKQSIRLFALGFVVLSLLWIYATDGLVVALNLTAEGSRWVSTLKGLIYVLVVAGLITRARVILIYGAEELARKKQASDFDALDRLARAAEFRDEASGHHNLRISLFAETIGRYLGFESDVLYELNRAATLHDVGKIATPDGILRKPGKLDPAEREEIERHVIAGDSILSNGRWSGIEVARRIARHHHESWDGSGYPDQLTGTDIPLEARVVSVCDVFDALLSERPYKPPWPWEEAVEEIRRLSGTKFDPNVVDAFNQALPDLECIWNKHR